MAKHALPYSIINENVPNVECSQGRLRLGCADWRCPKHNPDAYADCMARHATDSIPPIPFVVYSTEDSETGWTGL